MEQERTFAPALRRHGPVVAGDLAATLVLVVVCARVAAGSGDPLTVTTALLTAAAALATRAVVTLGTAWVLSQW